MGRTNGSLVSIVDDDVSVREALPALLQSFGHEVATFASAEAFLSSAEIRRTDCLLLDVRMEGMSGPALYLELRRLGHDIPVVFITANQDEVLRSRLLKQGAIECLFKPFSDGTLVSAIASALANR